MIWSQSIKGHLENEKQEPISDGIIQNNDNSNLYKSDEKGDFMIDGISTFPVSLTIKKSGFRDYELTLEESDLALNIILKKIL